MGRRLRTQLPVLPSTLVPRNLLREREEVAKKEEIYRSNQKNNFDRRHQVHELPDLTTGESVWIRDQDRLGTVQGRTQHPGSYLVETKKGTVRRNRSALVKAESHSTPVKGDNQDTRTSSVSDQPVDDSDGHSAAASPCVTSDVSRKHLVCRESGLMQTRSGRIVRPPNRLDL